MATLFTSPVFAPVSNGANYPNAKLYLYATGTLTPISSYTAADLLTLHNWPVVASAYGVFAPIYINNAVNATYRARLLNEDNGLVFDYDGIPA